MGLYCLAGLDVTYRYADSPTPVKPGIHVRAPLGRPDLIWSGVDRPNVTLREA
jgi:hypothetical protein